MIDHFCVLLAKYRIVACVYAISTLCSSFLVLDSLALHIFSTVSLIILFAMIITNILLLLFYIYFYTTFFSERIDLTLLKCMKCWSVFVIACVLIKTGRHFEWDLGVGYYSWPLLYIAIFIVIALNLGNSKKLYTNSKLFADEQFAKQFSKRKTCKININGEIRNCLSLGPKECIEFSNPEGSYCKFGFGVTKKSVIFNKAFKLDFFTEDSSFEQISPKCIIPSEFAQGWHDFSISSNNETHTRKIKITNTNKFRNIISVRQSLIGQEDFKYVIVIIIDGISPDLLGLYNDSSGMTPNIDRFFSNSGSTGYSNAFSQAEWTLPTFASMMTSLYPSQHRVYDPNKYTNVLPKDLELLPEAMQKNGFATFGYVSHTRCGPRYGHFRGFNEFVYRQVDMRAKHSYQDITKRAVTFLQENQHENKFVFLHYFDTHTPFFPSLDSRVKYGDDNDKLLAMKLSEVDQSLQCIFEVLEKNGALKNSMVILTADHGPGALGQPDDLEIDIREANTRIPFLVYCPWKPQSFVIDDVMVEASIDILPTIFDALGLTIPDHAEGRSVFADKDMRKKYAISESLFDDKYELVQRFPDYKNYIRLSRNRKKNKIHLNKNIYDCIQSVGPDGQLGKEILDSKKQLAELWTAKFNK